MTVNSVFKERFKPDRSAKLLNGIVYILNEFFYKFQVDWSSRLSYEVSSVIIYMQNFCHADWLRARQLFPNRAESWNWVQKVEIKWCAAQGKWRYFNTEFEGDRYEQKHLIKHK